MTGTDLKVKSRRDVDNLDEVFHNARVDFSNISVGCHANVNFKFCLTVIPEDYLRFARKDFATGGNRGMVNALSNAKRCIDCLIDCVFKSLGLNLAIADEVVNQFCDDVLDSHARAIKPRSLRLFTALGFAPTLLINEVRRLRNSVEHEWSIPETIDVKRAIEVAELLLNNIKAKEHYSASIDITDHKSQTGHHGHITGVFFSEASQVNSNDSSTFIIRSTQTREGERLQYRFSGHELSFLYLLRAMFVGYHDEEALKDTVQKLLFKLDLQTAKEKINVVTAH